MADPRRVTVVAEAAQGFEGSPTLARLLVRAAAVGEADVVKFQLVYADELAVPAYAYHELFRRLEMPDTAWREVVGEARRLGLKVAFDVFGLRSLGLAIELGAAAVKIHASDFFNTRLIDVAVTCNVPLFVSAGGMTFKEIEGVVTAHAARAHTLTLMYGFQAEPTVLEDNHLSRLGTLRERLPGLSLGFMDHASGDDDEAGWLGLLALPFGVSVIEKHITLSRNVELEDSVSALEPREFTRYVARIRAAERALGSAGLELRPAEEAYRRRAVKVVVMARPIAGGRPVGDDDVAALRAPVETGRRTFERMKDVVGRIAVRDLAAGAPVYEDDLA
jgi:N,N'-diacetyllegionaminate synthase